MKRSRDGDVKHRTLDTVVNQTGLGALSGRLPDPVWVKGTMQNDSGNSLLGSFGFKIALSMIALVAGISGQSVSAWESDLHYGLTKWLAQQAGFTDDAAEVVAQGNLDMDEGVYSAPHSVTLYTCFFPDINGSRLVRDKHFPTFVDLPSPPDKRPVEANSRAARVRAEQEAKTRAPSTFGQQQRASLSSFGEALHPLQDSWSHQGVPGVPRVSFLFFVLSCNRDLAWAHPATRGGWRSHDADLTHLWPADALAVARATYELMQWYLSINSWAAAKAGKAWSVIEREVSLFGNAKTKTEKGEWFRTRGFLTSGFLNGISLSDGKTRFAGPSAKRAFLAVPPATKIVPDLDPFFEKLFSMWMTSQGLQQQDRLIKEFVDVDSVAKSAGLEKFGAARDVATTAFFSWRIRDHGRVAELGHSSPDGGPEKFKMLAAMTRNVEEWVYYKSILEAMARFGGKNGPRFIVVKGDGPRYLAVAQFRHAPNDLVMLEAQLVKGEWRVSGIDWVVEH